MSSQSKGLLLISAGLLGLAGYEIALHLTHASRLAGDRVHGFWVGVCLGLGLFGLFRLAKARRSGAA